MWILRKVNCKWFVKFVNVQGKGLLAFMSVSIYREAIRQAHYQELRDAMRKSIKVCVRVSCAGGSGVVNVRELRVWQAVI